MRGGVSPMLDQIHSLPKMLGECLPPFTQAVQAALPDGLCSSVRRFYLVGCGDSHHAALGAELAFLTFTGTPCVAMTALHFARYTAPLLSDASGIAVIGISVSGEVARTIEALRLADRKGATTIAITGDPSSRLADSAEYLVHAKIPPFPTPKGMVVPGVRSYAASLLLLYLMAIQVGEARGFLACESAASARGELASLPEGMDVTIQANEAVIQDLVNSWEDANKFVFVGGGPNYGTALFSAAKLLEASGDAAVGQDTEEWTHLQYFAREQATPTFIIDAGGRSTSRAREVAVAARTIGRRVAAIVPREESVIAAEAEVVLPVQAQVREAFSPILYGLTGMLFAAYRAQLLGAPYFRDFSGGRSVEGGGGISRIRTSALQGENES